MLTTPKQRGLWPHLLVVPPKFSVHNYLKQGNWKSPRVLMAAGLVVLLAISAGLAWNSRFNALAVMVNDERVAVVEEIETAEQALQSLLAEKSLAIPGKVKFLDQIRFAAARANREELATIEELRRILAHKLTFVSEVTGIALNGEVKLWVADEQSAREVIDRVKQVNTPQGEGITLDELELEENVAFISREGEPSQVTGIEEAVNVLLNGTAKTVRYTVQPGDSLWGIARSNQLRLKDLLDANPQLQSDLLMVGQELNLLKAEPLVHVVASYRRSVTEYIPYPIKVNYDDGQWRGQERVLQRGREGVKQVQYRVVERNGIVLAREVLEEKVLDPPQEKIISRGTRVMLASRDGGGSSRLGRPLRGSITSPFGPRRGEFHTGVDLDGVMGDPVFAAEAGMVTFVGWRGNYGKQVVIDHGEGLATAYSHLSAYRVSEGKRVARGDIIGLVGSTGRSTGSHLHFEVIVEGNFHNPLDYLGR